jgi:hypothetical protein
MMVSSRVFDADNFSLPRIWKELPEQAQYYERLKAIQDFNQKSAWRKRGISMTPCRCALGLVTQKPIEKTHFMKWVSVAQARHIPGCLAPLNPKPYRCAPTSSTGSTGRRHSVCGSVILLF